MGEIIPLDIAEAANKLSRSAGIDSSGISVTIARAILAERQRCVDVADRWAKNDLLDGETRLAAAYIRREILNP